MKIILNGKENDIETGLTAFQLRDEKFNSMCIVILNGFQISEDCTLKENDTIAVIEKGKMPSQDELESLMASRHTPFVHERFKKGRVAIAGLGGLGSNIAVMLARIGVGYLKLIDFDIVEPTQKERLSFAKQQVIDTFKKVFPYILIGVGIGAVIHNWIPESWVEKILGSDNPFGAILATLVGIPMYADIFGTIPVAEALLAKGAQLGTILSFMMGVTTLSLPSMIMLRKAVKPKLLGIFIVICAVGIIIVGYFFNAIQYLLV